MSNKARLLALERRQPARRGFATLFEQDGQYWQCDLLDYRASLDPAAPGAHRLTADEVRRLELTKSVLIVRYERMKP